MNPDTSTLTIAGTKLNASLDEAITGLTLDASEGSVALLSIEASDDTERLVNSELGVLGTSVTWRGEAWQVGAIRTGFTNPNIVTFGFDCRSTLARTLRRNYKASVEQKVSPSEWVRRRVIAAGGTAVVQPSASMGTIAQTSGDQRQSELDVIAALASQLDWTWVESGKRLLFGSRYWAWRGGLAGQNTWAFTWTQAVGTDVLEASIALDADDTENHATGSITVPYDRGIQIRPWDLISLSAGFGRSAGTYLATHVAATCDGITPIQVDITRPMPPAKKSGSSS